MRAEVALVGWLGEDTAVATLVSDRIYQLVLRQNVTLPAIRVQEIDEPLGYHLRGEDGLRQTRVQVDSYAHAASGADPYADASAVAEAVNAALSGRFFRRTGIDGIDVTAMFRQNRLTLWDSDELRIVRVMQDYYVWNRPLRENPDVTVSLTGTTGATQLGA